MYGQVGGVAAAAGIPAALAFTGVTGIGFAVMLSVAFGSIALGVCLLRWVHRSA